MDLAARHATPLSAAQIEAFRARLAAGPDPVDDAERIDVLAALERLVATCAGVQADTEVAFDASQRAQAATAGVPAERQGRGIAHQVALARRTSPRRAELALAAAKARAIDLPKAAAALRAGELSPRRADTLARETACLEPAKRTLVDDRMAALAQEQQGWDDRAYEHRVRAIVIEVDNAAVARRRRRAESERHVRVRPAPDAMAWVTALLPMKDAVSAFASLKVHADHAVGVGEASSHAGAMADEFVRRLTGRSPEQPVPVEISLIMTDRNLFGGADEPATVPEYGPIPGDLARSLVAAGVDAGSRAWLRRLYTSPSTGELVALDSRQRFFPRGLARFIRLRDQWCRTPGCTSEIRHYDHIHPAADGGPTSAVNGLGRCAGCNHAKQAPGWHEKPDPGDRHAVIITTPTGHTYRSHPPPLPGVA